MKNNKSRHFNMLEVILAITVIGAGLTLLLVLFPVATRTATETVDNNYIPMVVNNFITYANANIDYYAADSTPTFWPTEYLSKAPSSGTTDDLPAIPDIDEIEGTHDGLTIAHIDNGKAEDEEPVSLYSCKKSGDLVGYCAVVRGGLDTSTTPEKYTLVDFTAYVKLELTKAADLKDNSGRPEIVYYSEPFWINSSSSPVNAISNTNLQGSFARITLTVFWPLEVPPSARKSRVFIIEKAWLQ
ncbi:MAG: hypothetical protein VB042_02715 [Victivallaceae bacterium]|nr:hypothetical protein [Victivallaceae bacterium]